MHSSSDRLIRRKRPILGTISGALLAICLAVAPVVAQADEPSPQVSVGTELTRGSRLVSPSGRYQLVFQDDGNWVLRDNGTATWRSDTSGAGIRISFQGDGNLVIRNGGKVVSATGTNGSGAARLFMQDDGNLVMRTEDGRAVWALWSQSGSRVVLKALKNSGASAATAATPSAPAIPLEGQRAAVIDIAKRYVGVPYRWGGTTPSGFDCSGFTQYVFRQVGISLPRLVREQRNAGRVVSRADARPGDIVWTSTHVAIYAGDNIEIDAPKPGGRVVVRKIWQPNPIFIRVIND